MEQLPQEIHKKIGMFLKPEDALDLSSTSKHMREGIDLAPLNDTFSHKEQLKDQHWYGGYADGDREKIWFRFMPLFLQDKVHTIKFTCEFKDQGWGNRKSRLYIREDKNDGNHQGEVIAETPIAEHHATNVTLEFQPRPGKNYTMCFVVGGGGGHELFVRNARILTLVYGRTIANIASLFQKNALVPLVNNQFGVAMMKSSIDILIRSLDRGEEQDESLSSCFTDIGIDTTKKDILKAIKNFITLYLDFKSLNLSRDIVDEEMDSKGSDYDDGEYENSESSEEDYISGESD